MHDYNNDILISLELARQVDRHGGCCYYVGGYVRDGLMHRENKDIDIEVHNITPIQLEQILDSLGERISIGESFGIYNIKGCSMDVAMPRREKRRGDGHKDFDVSVDPFIGTKAAARRRDFTVNTLMQNVLTGEIIDHFNGLDDLRLGLLRHVNDVSFTEDPLRVLRAAQFAARFGFTVAAETIELCSKMDLSHLPKERIEGEMEKALLKAERPSVFFEVLREMDQLDFWFPELKALIGVPQNPRYHAEGDVWNHTMLVLDEAAKLKEKTASPLFFMLSALCHDFGKPLCTEEINGVLHAYRHESLGLAPAWSFLRRISSETKLIQYALNLTELHMLPLVCAQNKVSIKSTNRMFDRAIDPVGLICITLADDRGRINAEPAASYEAFLWERLEIYRDYMSRPYVMGRDLLDAGLSPGKDFAEILSYAHKLHLAGVEKSAAMKQCLAYAKKLNK